MRLGGLHGPAVTDKAAQLPACGDATHTSERHCPLPSDTYLGTDRLSSQNALRCSVGNFQSYEGTKYDRLSTLLLISEARCVHVQGGSLGTVVPKLFCLARLFGH